LRRHVLTIDVLSLTAAARANEALKWKFKNPLGAIPVSEFSKEAVPGDSGIVEQLEKRSYRIAIPLLAKLSDGDITTMLVVQQVGSVVFLGLFVVLSREIVHDPLSALFLGLMAATSFMGQWGFNDFTNFDGLSYLVLLLTLWTRSATAIAALTTFGGLADERVILAVPLVWLWQCMRPSTERDCKRRKGVVKMDRAHIGLVFGLFGFIVIRIWLACIFGTMVNTSGMSLSVMKNNLLWLPLALGGGVKGGLLLFLSAGWVLFCHRRLGPFVIGGLAFAPVLFAALAVYDLTRSLAYGFPLYFIAIRMLALNVRAQDMRRLTFCAAMGCLVLPTYWVLLRVYFLLPVLRLV
jgi:hypothetical protein